MMMQTLPIGSIVNNTYNWIADDICLCGNPEKCPKKNTCLRNKKKTGIHTYSLFYQKDKDCEYYIPIRRKHE
jgi:hypothetical protein